jgi:hypothetical protein
VGLKDFIFGSGRGKSRASKLVKTVIQPYTQSADRYAAMQSLLDEGSDEALVAVFRRFTITATKTIEDEEEKGWAYRQLRDRGAAVIPALKTYVLEHDAIAWALRVLEDVTDADPAAEWDILDALVAKHPPGYERDPSKKVQFLTHLAEIDDPKVATVLARYLDDADEGVRYLCVDQLVDIADPSTARALIDRLCNPKEESIRLKARILRGLASLGWALGDQAERVRANLVSGYDVAAGKVVER